MNASPARTVLPAAVAALLTAAAAPAPAWGPHPDITRAALVALGTNDPLAVALGPETSKLADYCWMPDWRRSLIVQGGDAFRPDDFLLFPAAATHINHMAPEVRTTWEPYFRRALQALRTETPQNAARWTGTLVHFIEDTAAPPHAFPTGGKLHGPMENWIVGPQVRVAPRPFAAFDGSDDAAVALFAKRMEALESRCRERGARIAALAAKEDRAAVEPIALESAGDAAATVAETLHLLGTLAARTPAGGAALTGAVVAASAPGLGRVPAKVMLAGTSFSTLCDAGGRFVFRHLPPGRRVAIALFAGSTMPAGETAVELVEGGTAACEVRMAPCGAAGGLLRNADFAVRWVRPDAPDAWHPQKGAWESEVVPAAPGARYRLSVAWAAGATNGSVAVRWRNTPAPSGGQTVMDAPLHPGTADAVFVTPTNMTHARIVIENADDPRKLCDRVNWVRE